MIFNFNTYTCRLQIADQCVHSRNLASAFIIRSLVSVLLNMLHAKLHHSSYSFVADQVGFILT